MSTTSTDTQADRAAAQALTAALLQVTGTARWPDGPLLLDLDAAVVRELLAPQLVAELTRPASSTGAHTGARTGSRTGSRTGGAAASSSGGATRDPGPVAARSQVPDAPAASGASSVVSPAALLDAGLLTAALVSVSSRARWPGGPLLVDLHPTVVRQLLAPPLLAVLTGGRSPAPAAAAAAAAAASRAGGPSALSATPVTSPC